MTARAPEQAGSGQAMVCPGGPLLLRGARSYTDDAGVEHEIDRPVVAVCRCELSSLLPWCDSTHKRLPEDKRPR
ncbi:CDGSH iron-sulfur domain-containing protein [Ornithinimicrobium cavernae]|uniref:CDGSH iron-sulfur domain-containing protein n=1 Tax=Ornithinimicrobium cavernae TaxID=2666047 RepID=UPI000D696021|nr:CDGSH iron-sulfur domain-containing protein [Ornithinimicrobium cavernae]